MAMRRLFVILPDHDSCKAVVNDLEQQGVPEHHLHVIAGLNQDTADLPKASVWQSTELLDGILWGVALGGTAGMLGGLLVSAFPPPGMEVDGLSLSVLAAVGALLGGGVSALISSHEHNHQLDSFEAAVAAGQLLLMVDVPRRQVTQMQETIRQRHPEAHITIARRKGA